jgi:FixJ family two-component response regulator
MTGGEPFRSPETMLPEWMMESPPPVVCVVDDDESVRESLTGLLRSVGFDGRAFDSGEDLLARSIPGDFDCILLDVMMPGISGVELHQQLLDQGERIPIVFITARLDETLRARLLAQGAVACLAKPFQEVDLLSAVEAAVLAKRRGSHG